MEKGPNSLIRLARRQALAQEKREAQEELAEARKKLKDVTWAIFHEPQPEPLVNSFEAMIRYKEKASPGVK